LDEASGESFPGYGVGVNIGGVFGRRGPPWRRCVGMLPALVCIFRMETSSFLRRSDDDGIGAISFLWASLWKSWAFVRRLWCCIVVALEDWSEF
jgi:hypothetical protein